MRGRSGDWAAALAALDDRQVDVCLEIGPASRLELIGHSPASKDLSALSLPSLLPAEQGGVDVLTTIGTLYAAGADPLWDRLAPPDGRCVRVPTYPWQRQRLWTLRKNWLAGLSAAGSEEPGLKPAQSPVGDGPRPAEESAATRPAAEKPQPRPDLITPYVAPRSALEGAMAESWSRILGIDPVGIHDNFFELGGDSLQAAILLNLVSTRFAHPVSVPLRDLFATPTIAALAERIEAALPSDDAGAQPRWFPFRGTACCPCRSIKRPCGFSTAWSPSVRRTCCTWR